MEELTNELLSEVFGKDTVYIKDNTSLNFDGNQIVYYFKNKHPKFGDTVRARAINKYEFMHLCKEYTTDYEKSNCGLSTHKTFYSQCDGTEWYCGFAKIKTTYDDKATFKDISKGDTEFEAVIKATKWVIENKDKS